MELAKIGLAEVKEMLDDGWGDFDVIEENGVILDCFRVSFPTTSGCSQAATIRICGGSLKGR